MMISKADKGDTMIMATLHYLDLAYKQLDDKETYQLLSNDPTQEIVKQFHQYLDLCLRDRVISKVEHDKLIVPHSIETQTMLSRKFKKTQLN